MREPITPSEAVNRLLSIHYTGRKKGAPINARLNLIGALMFGQIEWQCEIWREVYTAENGATYDEAGGETAESPKYGYPPDFWRAEIARDETGWQYSTFIVSDEVNSLTVPASVAIWLGGNGNGIASRVRHAKNITIDWEQVEAVLGGTGWSAWRAEAKIPGPRRKQSEDYKTALIRLIAVALHNPSAFKGPLFELVHDAFHNPPDDAEIRRLVKRIATSIAPDEPPPID